MNTGGFVNLRSCPALNCAVLASVGPADAFMIHASRDGWYQVTLETGDAGYIFAELVNVAEGFTAGDVPLVTPIPPTVDPVLIANSTATAEALGPLITSKTDGTYLVGVDIAPGQWRSRMGQRFCKWQRLSREGGTLDDYIGPSGGTVTIRPNDYEVTFEDCGVFFYVDPNAPVFLQAIATTPKTEGVYQVGVNIAAGLWRGYASSDGCTYIFFDRNQELIDIDEILGEGNFRIPEHVYEVEISWCERIEYLNL